MKYILSLGTNTGDTFENLKEAIRRLEENSVFVDDCSSVYATSPVDYLYLKNKFWREHLCYLQNNPRILLVLISFTNFTVYVKYILGL